MKQAYPIILTPSENGYVVYVPDLDINTEEGSRRRHRHGRRRYRPLGISAQDLGREIPAPSAALPTCTPPQTASMPWWTLMPTAGPTTCGPSARTSRFKAGSMTWLKKPVSTSLRSSRMP